LYSCGRGDEFQLGLSDAPLAMETRDLTLEFIMESQSKFVVRVPTPVSNLEGIKVGLFIYFLVYINIFLFSPYLRL